jgi:hypothetical protein
MSPIWHNCGHVLWSCSSLLPGGLVDAVTPGQPGVNTDERPRWRQHNADRASRAGDSGTCLGRNTCRLCRPGAARLARAAGNLPACEYGAWLDKSGAAGLEPAAALSELATATNPDVVLEWWTRWPYSVLLPCVHRRLDTARLGRGSPSTARGAEPLTWRHAIQPRLSKPRLCRGCPDPLPRRRTHAHIDRRGGLDHGWQW